MALQLVYTSARRLLEAGRSGFGTVARHREISPLLVSAVERISQFSRQPGLDIARVIFSHQIIPISGHRYHVLSCIRDAGADYTGRTNHLAHHVIVDAREISPMGSRAPTPAEVLLAMPWIESWEEQPRYFTDAEAVDLGRFHQQTGSQNAAWAHATGAPENAWLLVNGPASRGAYIIGPPGLELRWLFAESMRLAPDRAWQYSLTTSLQPSDESSDFRWIGMEENSVLAGQMETSARPVLDLRHPKTLPIPEVPSAPPSPSSPEPLVPAVGSTLLAGSEPAIPSPTESPVVKARAATHWPPMPQEPLRPPSPAALAAQKRRSLRLVGMIAAAAGGIALLAAASFFAVSLKQRRDARAGIAQTLKSSGFFPEESLPEIAVFLLPKLRDAGRAQTDASAITKVAERVFRADLQGLQGDVAKGEIERLHEICQRPPPPAPRELTTLNTQVDQIGAIQKWKPAPDIKGVDSAFQEQLARIDSALTGPHRENIRRALSAISYQTLMAQILDSLKNERIKPADSVEVYRARIDSLRGMFSPAGGDQDLAGITAIIDLWALTEKPDAPNAIESLRRLLERGASTNPWPIWLQTKANEILRAHPSASYAAAPEPPPATVESPKLETPSLSSVSAAPVYLAQGLPGLAKLKLSASGEGITYFLQHGPGLPAVKLLEIDAKLRQNFGDDKPTFEIQYQDNPRLVQQIRGGGAAAGLAFPFAILAKKADDSELFEIWVLSPDRSPFPTRREGITRVGDSLKLDPSLLPFRGQLPLRLTIPDECYLPGPKNPPLPVTDWTVDIGPLRTVLEKHRAFLQGQAKDDGPQTASGIIPGVPVSNQAGKDLDPKTAFLSKKELVRSVATREIQQWFEENDPSKKRGTAPSDLQARVKRLSEDKIKKQQQLALRLGDDSSPAYKQLAGCIIVVAEKVDPRLAGWNPLLKSGQVLRDGGVGMPESTVAAITHNVNEARSHLITPTDKSRYAEVLDALQEMARLLPELESKGTKELRPIAGKAPPRPAVEDELARIARNPLLTSATPPGAYQLIGQADGKDIVLLQIEIP